MMSDPIFQPSSSYRTQRHHGRGIVRTALIWTAVAVVAMIAFGTFAWAVGLVFHLIGFLIKVALVTAVVAVVWRFFSRRGRARWYS
jgi:hypothetical protein